MKKLSLICFGLLLLLSACTHAQPDRSAEQAAAIAALSLQEVDAQSASVETEISLLEEQVRSAQSRRDYFRLQATRDAAKQDAVEGTEAQIASLEAKLSSAEHRKHLLDARRRELAGQAK